MRGRGLPSCREVVLDVTWRYGALGWYVVGSELFLARLWVCFWGGGGVSLK